MREGGGERMKLCLCSAPLREMSPSHTGIESTVFSERESNSFVGLVLQSLPDQEMSQRCSSMAPSVRPKSSILVG